MSPLYTLGWSILLLLSMWFVFEAVGMRLMCLYFPEGRRWWQLPLQLVSLAVFAAVVLAHPF